MKDKTQARSDLCKHLAISNCKISVPFAVNPYFYIFYIHFKIT